MAKVTRAYKDYPVFSLEKSWLTLASVLDSIICHNGRNDFKIEHMAKEPYLNWNSYLPLWLYATTDALQIVEAYDEQEEEIKLMQLEEL